VVFRNYRFSKFSCYCVVAADRLSLTTEFHVVLEDDGSILCDDVLDMIFLEKEKIGTLMFLQHDEKWTPAMSGIQNFRQRVSIACYAERCLSHDRFCPTVRPSV